MHYRKITREVKLLTFNSCAPKVLLLADRVELKNTAKPSQQSKTTHTHKKSFYLFPFSL